MSEQSDSEPIPGYVGPQGDAVPYPASHMYATVLGDCYGAAERWQFGFRLTDGGASAEATALALSDDIQRWWTASGYVAASGYYPLTTHRLTELKVARINPDGKYPATEAAYSHFYLPPLAGTYSLPSRILPQATICCSLTTALPRGLASKGRMFLPPEQAANVNADGRMAPSDVARVARSVAQLISEINANSLVGNVAIFSRGRAERDPNAAGTKIVYTYPNPGAVQNVTGTRVGRVIDTQRSRRRALLEEHEIAPVAL